MAATVSTKPLEIVFVFLAFKTLFAHHSLPTWGVNLKSQIQLRSPCRSLTAHGESEKEFSWMSADGTLNLELVVLIVIQNSC